MLDTIYKTVMLLVPVVMIFSIWAVFELRHQRDFWREHYCYEVLKTTPEHVCAENFNE